MKTKGFFVRLFALVVLAGASMATLVPSANAREVNSAEIVCIAKTIDGEARSEPRDGKIAVGLVIKARMSDGRWPSTACGVVKQKSQFNGYWNGKASSEAIEIASAVLAGGHSMTRVFGRGNECIRYFDSKKQGFMREVKKIGRHYFGC